MSRGSTKHVCQIRFRNCCPPSWIFLLPVQLSLPWCGGANHYIILNACTWGFTIHPCSIKERASGGCIPLSYIALSRRCGSSGDFGAFVLRVDVSRFGPGTVIWHVDHMKGGFAFAPLVMQILKSRCVQKFILVLSILNSISCRIMMITLYCPMIMKTQKG